MTAGKFLTKIDKRVPDHLQIHLICDNYGTHATSGIRAWLQRVLANGNRILAQTSDICASNSGATYLALVAFMRNNKTVPTLEQAPDLANRIGPLITGQGLPSADMSNTYVTREGRGTPIVVIYEHQYLAYQIRTQAQSGKPDADRVLLYPSFSFLTKPQFLGLDPRGEQLGKLITFDPDLQRRALELGFRILTPVGNTSSAPLAQFLQERGIPVPSMQGDESTTPLPDVPVLEEMITDVGRCPQ